MEVSQSVPDGPTRGDAILKFYEFRVAYSDKIAPLKPRGRTHLEKQQDNGEGIREQI